MDRIIQSIYAESDYADSKNSIKQRLMFLRKDFNSIYIYNSKDKIFSYALNGTNKLDYNPIDENWYRETVAADGRERNDPGNVGYGFPVQSVTAIGI